LPARSQLRSSDAGWFAAKCKSPGIKRIGVDLRPPRLDLEVWARPTFTVLWAEVAIPAHAYFSRDWLAIYDDIATTKYQLCDRRICS
jgi:hypothetical protein